MLEIIPIPAFSDNYIWLIHNQQQAYVVDPGTAAPVLDYLQANNLLLSGILVTHWHADHIGGINDLQKQLGPLDVIGPRSSKIPQINQWVDDGAKLNILDNHFTVLSVPGHTLEHIAYYSVDVEAVFCGDTLFAGGCGRMFEGTAEMFWTSLQKLASLPAATRVFCAHEYTLSNLRFAIEADPDNTELQQRLIECEKLRADGQITLPSTIETEQATNPFLRATETSIITQALNQGASSTAAVDVFACLREWKNQF